MVQIAILINIKWFIRLILVGFWIVAAYMATSGQGFITWMVNEHTSTSLVLFFLSIYYLAGPFYAPFFQIKKKTQGGEILMEKSTKILLVIVAILASFLIVMFVSPSARETIITGANNTILKPAMGLWLGFVDWLDTVRGIYILGSGLVGGLMIAIIINQLALPKIRGKLPEPSGPSGIGLRSQTPTGATTRPSEEEPTLPLESETLEETESVEK